MKNIAFILILFETIVSSAKGSDTVQYRVSYKTIYSNYSNLCNSDLMVLDIGKVSSYFYSQNTKRKKSVLNKINERGNFDMTTIKNEMKNIEPGQEYQIYKNVPCDGKLTCYDSFLTDAVMYEDSLDTACWTLLDTDTTICGYPCQRAEISIRGRRWNAWYTSEIPINDGPWKLSGLPGLILAAADESGCYSFECIGIENKNNEQIDAPTDKYTKCSYKDFIKLYHRFYENPFSFIGSRIDGGAEKLPTVKTSTSVISIDEKK